MRQRIKELLKERNYDIKVVVKTKKKKDVLNYHKRRVLSEEEGDVLLEIHAPNWREHLFKDDGVLARVVSRILHGR